MSARRNPRTAAPRLDALPAPHEWIDAHLGGDELGPVEMFMDADAG